MNRKRFACLLLAALLLAVPFVASADTEQHVRNNGTEPVDVYAQIGDPAPDRTALSFIVCPAPVPYACGPEGGKRTGCRAG